MRDDFNKQLRVFRIITQSDVVEWHLNNFLIRGQNDFKIFVLGQNVSKYHSIYQSVTFIDINIKRKISIFSDVRALFLLMYYMVKYKPQIVHSIMPKAGLLSSISSFITLRPLRIHTFTGQVWANISGFKRYLFIKLDQVITLLNTTSLTDSPSQSNFLFENNILNHGKIISTLGIGSLSGVDLNIFNLKDILPFREEVRKKLNLKKEDFVLIFLGRKSIVKGIAYLYEAFDYLNDLNLKLLFIGPDESNGTLNQLQAKYSHLNKNIIELERVSNREMYLIASDLLCLPSSIEGFGSIVIDSASIGIPTVGFEIVGLMDAVQNNETGFLVEYGNSYKLSIAIRKLVVDNHLYLKFKENCILRVRNNFDADLIYNFQRAFYFNNLK